MRTDDLSIFRFLASLVVISIVSGCLSNTEPGGSDVDLSASSGDSANSPPTISGSPPSAVLIGDVYSFTPTASDSDGDTLTFSVNNLPRWATLDSRTGSISGSVTLGDEGVYDNIRLTVSDGTTARSLREFSVTVTNVGLGSMTLSWTAPTENSDGTALVDLAGFYVYFGVAEGNYTNRVQINNPSISTYVIENLLPDTYYVVARSFNSQGIESTYSNVAIKSVTGD